mmetsp:Transcript_36590/g.79081  ORF Transcript_36590/g.79081 Transcript_36590/m.79081 type:complete len:84 (-) Transcript_36590:2-253(-)
MSRMLCLSVLSPFFEGLVLLRTHITKEKLVCAPIMLCSHCFFKNILYAIVVRPMMSVKSFSCFVLPCTTIAVEPFLRRHENSK